LASQPFPSGSEGTRLATFELNARQLLPKMAGSLVQRYTVRALAAPSHGRYCIWDHESNDIAAGSGDRQYNDLSFEEAFNAVDHLYGVGGERD
jgi:hypothetical protein